MRIIDLDNALKYDFGSIVIESINKYVLPKLRENGASDSELSAWTKYDNPGRITKWVVNALKNKFARSLKASGLDEDDGLEEDEAYDNLEDEFDDCVATAYAEVLEGFQTGGGRFGKILHGEMPNSLSSGAYGFVSYLNVAMSNFISERFSEFEDRLKNHVDYDSIEESEEDLQYSNSSADNRLLSEMEDFFSQPNAVEKVRDAVREELAAIFDPNDKMGRLVAEYMIPDDVSSDGEYMFSDIWNYSKTAKKIWEHIQNHPEDAPVSRRGNQFKDLRMVYNYIYTFVRDFVEKSMPKVFERALGKLGFSTELYDFEKFAEYFQNIDTHDWKNKYLWQHSNYRNRMKSRKSSVSIALMRIARILDSIDFDF